MKKVLSKIFSQYSKSGVYRRNVMIMVIGRAGAQMISILISPLLTRIYSPEEFGIFAVYSTIVTIMAMVSSGRYCLAVILPERERDAKDLVLMSSVISILSTVFFLALIYIWGSDFFMLIKSDILEKYTSVIVLNILGVALHEALFYYALRLKRYKLLATDAVLFTSIVVVTRLWFGYSGYTEFGLFASYMFGYTFSLGYLFFRLSIIQKFGAIKFSVKHYKPLLLKYLKFPKYSLFADTLNLTALMSPNLFLNKMFGSATAGFFSMSDKVLGSPIWLITMSVGDVFKQEASEQVKKNGNCFDIFVKTVRSLFILGFIPFLLLFIISPYVFPIIFGENWGPVGYYIRIFAIMYFAKFVVNPVSHVVYILNKQNYNILFQSLKIISIIIAFGFGFLLNSVDLGLILWSGLTTVSYIIIFWISLMLVRGAENI